MGRAALTAAQLRALRAALKLTQYELGRKLYLSGPHPDRVIRRWEAGTVEISGPAIKALEMIAKDEGIILKRIRPSPSQSLPQRGL